MLRSSLTAEVPDRSNKSDQQQQQQQQELPSGVKLGSNGSASKDQQQGGEGARGAVAAVSSNGGSHSGSGLHYCADHTQDDVQQIILRDPAITVRN